MVLGFSKWFWMSRKSGHSLEGLDVKHPNHLIILKLCITYENGGCDFKKCGYLMSYVQTSLGLCIT